MRPEWDVYFMDLARAASSRSTCDRAHVGCVIVQEKQVVATGYNGSISGTPHCDDVGHLVLDGHCVRGNHAEANAISNAAKRGIRTEGSACYVTHFPCWRCFKNLAQAGVSKVIYNEFKSNKMNKDIYDLMVAAPMQVLDLKQRPMAEAIKIVNGEAIYQ